MSKIIELTTEIPSHYAGKRLDQVLASLYSQHSRERIKSWILSGACSINGHRCLPKNKVAGNETVQIKAEVPAPITLKAEPLELDIIYEDEDLIIVNKSDNCVVHPANGNTSGTLLNALLHHTPILEQLPRAGIVHRLDKDTTGLLAVAKNLKAYTHLVNSLHTKIIKRIYEAIVLGTPTAGGTINKPIGRHPTNRIKMSVVASGKSSITHYRIIQKFPYHTHLLVQLDTGRTHQIRVHLKDLRHSIVGDKLYGSRMRMPKGATEILLKTLQTFPRQALHAKQLGLIHPRKGKMISWEAPLPNDMRTLLRLLRISYPNSTLT